MTPYERGHLDGQIAMRERAANYAATHTGSESPVFRETVIGTETLRFAYPWQRAIYAGIFSLQPEAGADQREAAAGPCVSVPRAVLENAVRWLEGNATSCDAGFQWPVALAEEFRSLLAAAKEE